jgi:hypothetical protein
MKLYGGMYGWALEFVRWWLPGPGLQDLSLVCVCRVVKV